MRKKVLFIMHMPPPVHGAAMVGKYIHDSKIVNDSFDCHYENMTLARSLEDVGRGGVRKVFDLLSQLHRFRKTVSEFHPDLVYITPNAAGGAFYKDFIVVQYIKRCLKKYSSKAQIVVHYHNKGVSTRQNFVVDNILYRIFFRNLKVILLAKSLYRDVQKYVAEEDVFVCANGIPVSLPREFIAERKKKIPQILFLSNLIVSKGVIVLLDALKMLDERGIAFKCNVVGGETDELDAARFADEIAKRQLMDKVFFVGKKYGNEKNVYFENADVFVFPTFYYNEAFPLVNIEAMEYKLPIVTTEEGGIPDMVVDGENGLICERKNPAALADAVGQLLKDECLRTKLGENGYKKFKNEFTLDAFERRFLSILNKVLNKEG